MASANRLTGTAGGLTVVTARDGEPDWPAIDRLIAEWGPDVLVSGLPYNSDGTESDMTREVRGFVEQLAGRYELAVQTVDERLTSAEAELILREQRQGGVRRRRVKKGDVDRVAATLIAKAWLQDSPEKETQNNGD